LPLDGDAQPIGRGFDAITTARKRKLGRRRWSEIKVLVVTVIEGKGYSKEGIYT